MDRKHFAAAVVRQLEKSGISCILVGGSCVSIYTDEKYHWEDRQSLIHALWVAERHPIKIQKIKKWSEKEDEREKFAEFLAEFKKLGTK